MLSCRRSECTLLMSLEKNHRIVRPLHFSFCGSHLSVSGTLKLHLFAASPSIFVLGSRFISLPFFNVVDNI